MKINVTPNFAAMVRGNGKTTAYFHRFKIMKQAACPCNDEDQTMDHFLYQWTLLHTAREFLRNKVLKSVNRPANEKDLTTQHLKAYVTFTNLIVFEHL